MQNYCVENYNIYYPRFIEFLIQIFNLTQIVLRSDRGTSIFIKFLCILYEEEFSCTLFWGVFLSLFITSKNLGGGHKKLYRRIDFKRDKLGISGKVFAIEYDPNRNARIALIFYSDGEKRYILSPYDLKIGDTVCSDFDIAIKIGNSLPLNKIPLGTDVHNIEFRV